MVGVKGETLGNNPRFSEQTKPNQNSSQHRRRWSKCEEEEECGENGDERAVEECRVLIVDEIGGDDGMGWDGILWMENERRCYKLRENGGDHGTRAVFGGEQERQTERPYSTGLLASGIEGKKWLTCATTTRR